MRLSENNIEASEVPEELLQHLKEENSAVTQQINMNEIVGTHDILFVCLDTLRYDVAVEEEAQNRTPNLNKYGLWEKRQAPGNFTYPSHHSMFAGFLPCRFEDKNIFEREILFFPKKIGLGNQTPKNSFAFEGATFIEGLARVDYTTMCVGGVAFFDKRSDIGNVFPSMFQQSYWNNKFSCGVQSSFENQIDFIEKKVSPIEPEKKVFLYVNVSAIHYPNHFYLPGNKHDCKESHGAALRYVDEHVEKLLDVFRKRGKTFVIVCSDHGTCYGEDGILFHGVHHELIDTIPYKHFIL